MKITEDCINCGACAVECPTEAIYEPGIVWKIKENFMSPISEDHFFIITEICDECAGLNKIKCIAICPMNAIKRK
ncbi:MAG: 4Fe-4S binding protein [Ignavibacteriales bacterium]|nr:4Fe-4S binding protein [Ignavibacteriales bacterium]